MVKEIEPDNRTGIDKGFSISNVYLKCQRYIKNEKFQTLSGKLSWSHFDKIKRTWLSDLDAVKTAILRVNGLDLDLGKNG